MSDSDKKQDKQMSSPLRINIRSISSTPQTRHTDLQFSKNIEKKRFQKLILKQIHRKGLIKEMKDEEFF